MKQEIKRREKNRLCESTIPRKLGKIDNGIVAVTAWALMDYVSLIFEVYKPKERLLDTDTYRSKPEIAAQGTRNQSNGI